MASSPLSRAAAQAASLAAQQQYEVQHLQARTSYSPYTGQYASPLPPSSSSSMYHAQSSSSASSYGHTNNNNINNGNGAQSPVSVVSPLSLSTSSSSLSGGHLASPSSTLQSPSLSANNMSSPLSVTAPLTSSFSFGSPISGNGVGSSVGGGGSNRGSVTGVRLHRAGSPPAPLRPGATLRVASWLIRVLVNEELGGGFLTIRCRADTTIGGVKEAALDKIRAKRLLTAAGQRDALYPGHFALAVAGIPSLLDIVVGNTPSVGGGNSNGNGGLKTKEVRHVISDDAIAIDAPTGEARDSPLRTLYLVKTASESGVLQHGYIWKKSDAGIGAKYRKRYFILTADSLGYWTRVPADVDIPGAPKRWIPTDKMIRIDEAKMKKRKFAIHTSLEVGPQSNSNKTKKKNHLIVRFKTNTDADCIAWCKRLKSIIKQVRPTLLISFLHLRLQMTL
jgi:hypothetical protein